jgi:hypothetical protein
MSRYVIEGEWSGYTSQQQRVVHCSVHQASEKKLRAWAESNHAIRYTDGTCLVIRVRDCKPRERVAQRLGYMKLIRDCAYHGVSTVHELVNAENGIRAARES